MRVSVKKEDPGYTIRAFMYQPYLDGVPISNCLTADEEEGTVLVHRTATDGRVIRNQDATGFLTEQLYGKVELKLERGEDK